MRPPLVFAIDEVDDERYQRVFVFGLAFSEEQREGNQSIVG